MYKGLRGNVTMLLDGRAWGLLPGVGRTLALRERRLTEAAGGRIATDAGLGVFE